MIDISRLWLLTFTCWPQVFVLNIENLSIQPDRLRIPFVISVAGDTISFADNPTSILYARGSRSPFCTMHTRGIVAYDNGDCDGCETRSQTWYKWGAPCSGHSLRLSNYVHFGCSWLCGIRSAVTYAMSERTTDKMPTVPDDHQQPSPYHAFTHSNDKLWGAHECETRSTTRHICQRARNLDSAQFWLCAER